MNTSKILSIRMQQIAAADKEITEHARYIPCSEVHPDFYQKWKSALGRLLANKWLLEHDPAFKPE